MTALGSDASSDLCATEVTQPLARADALVVAGIEVEVEATDRGGDIATTQDELEGYRIVRAIVRSEGPAARIRRTRHQDLLRRPARRQQPQADRPPVVQPIQALSRRVRREQTETRMPIDGVEEIYVHADQLRKTVAGYLSKAGSSDNTGLLALARPNVAARARGSLEPLRRLGMPQMISVGVRLGVRTGVESCPRSGVSRSDCQQSRW